MLTVITPAATARLATVEDTRADLGLSVDDPSNARLARMLDQASSRIATMCNRAFGRQIYRERLLISCGSFVLAAGPVNRIISVSFSGSEPLALEQYALDGDTLKLAGARPYGAIGDGSAYNLTRAACSALVVEYEAGWVLPGEDPGTDFTGTAPLPADVEQAAIKLVSVALSEAGRDPTVRSENVQGVGSTTYAAQAPGSALPHAGAEAALQPYRLLPLY